MKRKLYAVLSLVVIAAIMLSLNLSFGSASKSTKNNTFKVGLVTDVGGVNDRSFNQSAYEGMMKASKELKIQVTLIQSKQMTDYIPNLQKLAKANYNLVIAVGFMMHDAVVTVAKQFPNTKFLIIDSEISNLPNVASAMFREEQAEYLAGVASAMLEKAKFGKTTGKNIFGVVGGMKIPPVDRYIAGFKAGVSSQIPNAKVLIKYAGKFDDPATGKQVALSEIADGADIVFQVAGQTGLGVIQAAKEKGVYAIGVDSDQNYVATNTVITSAIKRVDVATYSVIKDTLNGRFQKGIHYFELKNNGVGLAPFMKGVPKNINDQINKTMNDIKSGKIKIPTEVK